MQAPDQDPEPDHEPDNETAYELFRRGSQLLADRHPGAAAVLLERCLSQEPGKASILEALGRAYYEQGNHRRAADRFQEIVDANPLAHYAHFGLGLSQVRLGDRAAGRRHLRMAVFLRPQNEDYRRALERVGLAET
jgi:tetratricopeptide (TPR) repeat protein